MSCTRWWTPASAWGTDSGRVRKRRAGHRHRDCRTLGLRRNLGDVSKRSPGVVRPAGADDAGGAGDCRQSVHRMVGGFRSGRGSPFGPAAAAAGGGFRGAAGGHAARVRSLFTWNRRARSGRVCAHASGQLRFSFHRLRRRGYRHDHRRGARRHRRILRHGAFPGLERR